MMTKTATQTIKLPLGASDFKSIVSEGYYFVDKTLMVQEFIEDPAKIILITRPRRFGKTLNLSMLRYFFDCEDRESNKALFEPYQISQQKELSQQHQGQYPVISISLKKIKERTYEDALAEFSQLIFSLYEQFRYLLESEHLTEQDKRTIEAYLNKEADTTELKNSLKSLIIYLEKHHQIKPILLIDEYDEPIHASYQHGYYEEMKTFMRVFLGEALKDNPYLHKAVITGILRIAQASIFSGLNNIRVYTVLNKKYSQYFGFLPEEVSQLHKMINCTHPLSEIQDWYNGYQFDGTQVYNPWSIINAFSDDDVLRPYWVNTAENVFIKQLIRKSPLSVKHQLEDLLQGKPVYCTVNDSIVFSEIEKSPTSLWTLFISSGYLNMLDWKIDPQGLYEGEVRIPNYEVMTLYSRMVNEWFQETEYSDKGYQDFLKSLLDGDAERFAKLLKMYITESGSYFDFNKYTPEKVYHALMLGVVIGLRDRYIIKSNRESGGGRYDVMLLPKDKSNMGFLLEFKTAESAEVLEQTAEAGLAQVLESDYVTELKQNSIKNITAMGLAFSAKEVKVIKKELS